MNLMKLRVQKELANDRVKGNECTRPDPSVATPLRYIVDINNWQHFCGGEVWNLLRLPG